MTSAAISAATSSDNSTRLESQRTRLTENFDTFLTLLTAQMQNQDPLDPLKTNEFTSQLVQFSSVEQAIETNRLLEQLVSASGADSLTALVDYIGKTVSANGDTQTLLDDTAQWRYTLDRAADAVEIRVLDDLGRTVYSEIGQNAPGIHDFTWNGQNSAGVEQDTGRNYTLQVTAVDASGNPITPGVQISSQVLAVESGQDGSEFILRGGKANLADIVGVAG